MDTVHKIRGSTFIFPVPDTIGDLFYGAIESWMSEYYSTTMDFMTEVMKDLDAGVTPFEFRYRIDQKHSVGNLNQVNDINSNISLEPLISDLSFGKYIGMHDQIDNDTSGFFSKVINQHKAKLGQLIGYENLATEDPNQAEVIVLEREDEDEEKKALEE